MLYRNVTYGDLRRMKRDYGSLDDIFSENPLNDPEFAARTQHIPDDVYYFDVSVEEIAEWETAERAADEKFFLTTDDDENVLGLFREEVAVGALFVRRDGEWIPIRPNDDVAELDDQTIHQVFDKNIVAHWDGNRGHDSIRAFSKYL
jgi:hypothetical protein